MRDGAALVVEGRVEHFVPEPKSGKGDERFSVGRVPFAYSHGHIALGFRASAAVGGPMRESLDVRIHCGEVRGRRAILRLEVRDP